MRVRKVRRQVRKITEAEFSFDRFSETGPVRLANLILRSHLELVLVSLDQLGHFEVESVGVTASSAHEARLRHVFALDDEASQR